MPNAEDAPVTRGNSAPSCAKSLVNSATRCRNSCGTPRPKCSRGFERCSAGENIRLRRLQADLSNVDASTAQRLDIVEQRLTQIEKKLLLNPPRTI